MPTFKFEFTYTQKIPIFPPLFAHFGGRIGANIDLGFGYDTVGLQKFIASADKNAKPAAKKPVVRKKGTR